MARDSLKHELLIAINKSSKDRDTVQRSVVQVNIGGKNKTLNLVVRHVKSELSENYPDPLFLITLDEDFESSKPERINMVDEPSRDVNEYITHLRYSYQ
jgi:hypothetical protein